MRYPEFLSKGDLIGICAPSAGVGRKEESFDASLKAIHKEGWRTRETASVRLNDMRGGDAPARGKELNELFKAKVSELGLVYDKKEKVYKDKEEK